MEVLKKACNFCVYQERTQEEVREKLQSWQVGKDETEEVIAWLITENFINEGRFAKQYAGSKFRVKRWGRKKIVYNLRSKGVSRTCIHEALQEISEDDYSAAVVFLVKQKKKELSQITDPWQLRQRISTYLMGKGYTLNEFQDILLEELP